MYNWNSVHKDSNRQAVTCERTYWCFQQGEGPSKLREGWYPALVATVAVWSVATVRNISAFSAVFTGRGCRWCHVHLLATITDHTLTSITPSADSWPRVRGSGEFTEICAKRLQFQTLCYHYSLSKATLIIFIGFPSYKARCEDLEPAPAALFTFLAAASGGPAWRGS